MTERPQANDSNDLLIFDSVQTAEKLLAGGDISVAKDLVEQVLKCDPNNAEAMQVLGMCFYQVGEIQRAIGCFEFVLNSEVYVRRSPAETYADAHNGLSLCCSYKGEFTKAICSLERAIEYNPSFYYHNNLALCYHFSQNCDQAEESILTAMKSEGIGHPVIRRNAQKIGVNPTAPRILVGSLFSGDDEIQERWLDLQLKFLRSTTQKFDHVVCLDKSLGSSSFQGKTNIVGVRSLPSYYVHIWGLRLLSEYFRSVKDEYDFFLILDSDAFPIKLNWMDRLLSKMNPESRFDDKGQYLLSHGNDYEIAALLRNENFEARLHASVLFMRKKSLDHIDFEHDFVAIDALNCREKDACIHTYQFKKKEKIFPLIRTNKTNIHPIVGGVYFDSFYHHGGGSRKRLHFRSDMYHDYTKSHVAQFYTDSLFENPEAFVSGLAGWNKEEYVNN